MQRHELHDTPLSPSACRPNYGQGDTLARGFGALPVQQAEKDAGRRLHDLYVGRAIGLTELDEHIASCAALCERAADAGNPQEAEGWFQVMYAGIEERERRLDEGVDYFAVEGERARQALEGPRGGNRS